MRARPTAERAAPRLGVLVSVLMHLGLAAGLLLSFTKKIDLPSDTIQLVPVDLVTLADKTDVAPMVKPEEKIAPPDVPLIEPLPQEVAPPKLEVAPDAKPAPKKEKPKEEFNIDDIQKLLAKKAPANAKTGPRTIQAAGAGTSLTADLASLLTSQIYRCWSPPTGVVNAAGLVVLYEINLDRSGNVSGNPKLLSEGASPNTPRDAANQAAFRAIMGCQPYKLPLNRYNEWRNFSFRFDPKPVVGP